MKLDALLDGSDGAVKPVGYGKNPLVLSTDMQQLFTAEDSPLGVVKRPGFHLIRQAIVGQRKLIEAARIRNIQIAYSKIGFRRDGKDKGLWKRDFPTMCILGSRWMEICPELEPKEEDIVFIRKMPSAFFGTELLTIMIANGYDTLIIIGLNTSGCVRATTCDSFSYGFKTIIPEDCVGDLFGEEPHRVNLSDVNRRFADVVELDDVLDYFDRLAKK